MVRLKFIVHPLNELILKKYSSFYQNQTDTCFEEYNLQAMQFSSEIGDVS